MQTTETPETADRDASQHSWRVLVCRKHLL